MTWSEDMDDARAVVERLVAAAKVAGMTVLGQMCHEFVPQGLSAVLLLAESHASIHTWPERGRAMLDVFSCSSSDAAARFVEHFVQASTVVALSQDVVVRGSE